MLRLKIQLLDSKLFLEGECDDIPENMFTYKGTIDEVFEAHKNAQN